MTQNKRREALADYAHRAWSGWMEYLFAKSQRNNDGSVTIPWDLVDRWKRQIATPYAELSDGEKESDRKEAAKMLKIMDEYWADEEGRCG